MKKTLLFTFAIICNVMSFAQVDDWRIHPNDAQYYIKGVFDVSMGSHPDYTLTNVETKGVTLNNPQVIYFGDYQDAHDDVMFTFNDVETNCPTKYDYISYWVYDDEINEWQPDVEIRSADRGMEHRKIMTVMLVLDCSSSLENEFVHDLKYVKEGALTFLRTMYNASHSGNIQIGIIGFNSLKRTLVRNIEPLNEGTFGEMCRFVNNFDVANGTALYYSIDKALAMINDNMRDVDSKDYVKPIVITFTDGVDQTSFDNSKGIKNADSYYSIVNNGIQKADIEHFVVPFLGSDIKTDAQKEKFERVLRSLTKPTDNDHYLPVKSMSELSYIFGQLASNLIDRWQILRCYVAPARQGKVCWTFGKKEKVKPVPAPEPKPEPKSDRPLMLGLNFGFGVPIEFGNYYSSYYRNGSYYSESVYVEGAGLDIQLCFDFAYPVTDKFAMGLYTSIGGGFTTGYEDRWGDNYYRGYVDGMFRFSAGLLMEMGELSKKPFLLGICPGIGFGFTDQSYFLPTELRFGRVFSNNWYMTGDILIGIPLGGVFFMEPSIRIGYNFGHKVYARKK